MKHYSRRSFLRLTHRVGLAPLLFPFGVGKIGSVAAALPQERGQLDRPVRDFRLRDVMREGDAWISLSEFKHKQHAVLAFISYNCNVSWRYEERLGKLTRDFAGKEVAFLALRSNALDSVEGIRRYAQATKLTMPVLDDENHRVADYFGIHVTPTFLVIDKEGTLRYWGAYDEHMDETVARQHYLHDALRAVLSGHRVPLRRTRTFG